MNKKYIRNGILAIVITLALVGTFFSRVITSTKLGLDLQGGIEILYLVKPIEGETLNEELMDSTVQILEKRINTFGISETVISKEGDDMIRIQVPGVDDQSSARELLGSSAVLTFRDSNDNYLMGADVLKSGNAKLTTDSMGNPAVRLGIADPDKMSEVTGNLVNSSDRTMVIWLDFEEGVDSFRAEEPYCGTSDSKCISAATVQSQLSSEAVITGNFTKEEATNLIGLINSGSLQVELVEEYSTTVGASFGEEALQKSILSAIVGLVVIMIFMIVKYRFCGVVSALGLIFYTFCVFTIFYVLGGVLTLPGIAALVLGIGMAIDANVISFERIKDEHRKENDIANAFKVGNKSSLLTIVDANVTTAIIAIILYFLGQSAIKGFATMLLINIFVTFLVNVVYTRFILGQFIKSDHYNNKAKLFIGYKEESKLSDKLETVSFINKNRIFFTVSVVLIIGGMLFGQIKGYNFGIDFTSGTSIISTIDESDYDEFSDYIEADFEVVESNYASSDNLAILRLSDTLTDEEINQINDFVADEYDSEVSIQKVSPLVGEDLIRNSIFSLLIAAVAIVIYITIRFRSSFAFAAIVALLHDLLMMLAMFAILRFTISGDFVAALLAILGYSINDTIVLFDRIRTNITNEINEAEGTSSKKKNKKKKKQQDEEKKVIEYPRLKEIVNESVKSTINRSLTTSVTTLLPVVALIVLGAREIIEFNFALAIGIVFGTYSSIFIAAQIWLLFERKGYFYGKKKDGWFSVEESKEKYID